MQISIADLPALPRRQAGDRQVEHAPKYIHLMDQQSCYKDSQKEDPQ